MLDRGRLLFLFSSFIVVFLLAAGSLVASSARAAEDPEDSPYKYLSVFLEVFGLVNKAYVDEPEQDVLLGGAFEGAIDALDPFSLYVPRDAVDSWQSSRDVGTGHSGLLVLKERGVAYAVAVEEGSPADEAGLEAGDILSAIDGRRTRKEPLYEIQRLLAGQPGTRIELERLRRGQKETIEMVLGEYPRPAVSLAARRGVPVLRVPSLDEGAARDVASSLEALVGGELADVEAPERLVLDLRGVAGGSESEAFAVADLFADDGALGSLIRRDETLERFDSTREARWTGRMAVLIDRSTQGAAEVLATTLRQRLEAELVGERTFGHAGRLDVVDLSDGGQLQITSAFYAGPDGEPLRSSLQPDHRVRAVIAASEPIEADDLVDDGSEEGSEGVEDATGSENEPATEPDAANDNEPSGASAEGASADEASADEAPAGGGAIDDPVLTKGIEVVLEDPEPEELRAVA